MSNPIEVGSVLGGRYKVTATVLTSHDHDLVLDGVDQVLNRPVSILVAGPDNTAQVAQSAREVATGERPGTVQVLDLGVSEDATYLITNHASAADLLDLVVASNPPYVEPFFTDTLGSEIFGQARSNEPEPYDDEEDNVEAGYINYAEAYPSQVDPYPTAPAQPVQPPARPLVPAPPAFTAPTPRPPAEEPAESPKVSLWSEEDYAQASTSDDYDEVPAADPEPAERRPSMFTKGAAAAGGAPPAQFDDADDTDEREPRSMRWLVGGLLAVVLVAGLIFAVTNLGRLTPSAPQAESTPSASSATTNGETPSQAPSSAAPVVPPAIARVTRLGNFDFAATFDGDLVKAYDGNAASYWSDMEFATEGWGGLAPDGVTLAIELKESATVSSITLSQLGGSGGNLTIYTNDTPTLEGAKSVGTNSFTSMDLNIPLAEPTQSKYVLVAINALPKLAQPKTRYGFGLRLAEIKVQ